MGYMIAVVGKRTAGLKYGAFSHDLIPLDHGGGAILIDENPFSAQQGNGGLSQVANGHEIYEGMQMTSLNDGLFLVMDEFVELGLETVQFFAVFLHG
jgi:hypothetical protein